MGIHNICLYKEVDKKYTGCNQKTTELLDCALIGVCVLIRSNTVYFFMGKVENVFLVKQKSEIVLGSWTMDLSNSALSPYQVHFVTC